MQLKRFELEYALKIPIANDARSRLLKLERVKRENYELDVDGFDFYE